MDKAKQDGMFKAMRVALETFMASETEATLDYSNVVKSESNGKKRLFTAVVLRPNVVDAHGDVYDYDVVEKACHNYNEFCGEGNLQHMIQTKLVVPVESAIAKSSYELGAGKVLAGDWVMTVRVDDDEVWEMCEKGDFTGFSVGCKSMSRKLTLETDTIKSWAATLTPLKDVN